MTKATQGNKRRSIKTRRYRYLRLGILRGDIKVDPELMQSITSPVWKQHIIDAVFQRMIDPKKSIQLAWREMGPFDYCTCTHEFDGLKPLASQWHPPKALVRLRQLGMAYPGKVSTVRARLNNFRIKCQNLCEQSKPKVPSGRGAP
jgi:hypothetical protein